MLRERFLQEARLAGSLMHPNIVVVFDLGWTGTGTPLIAVEHVPGARSLAEVLEETGALPAGRAVGIALQTALALGEAHARGVIHRDVKPDNLLVRPAENGRDAVKVIDFGLAHLQWGGRKGQARLTAQGMVLGTPAYMSPEQVMGLSLDARSDLYSLGVVLFEMLAGRRPFAAEDPRALAAQHVYEEVPGMGEGVPGGLARIVRRLLAKRVEERFGGAGEVVRALAGVGVS